MSLHINYITVWDMLRRKYIRRTLGVQYLGSRLLALKCCKRTTYLTSGPIVDLTLLNQEEVHSDICNDDEGTREDSKPDHIVPQAKRIEAESTEN